MRAFVLALLMLAGLSAVAGGGWVYSKGKGYFKLGESVISANSFYAPNGKIIDIRTISLYSSTIYGEYGLSDRWTAIIYMPFFVRETLNGVQRIQSGMSEPGDAVNAFGDTNLSIKYGFFQNKFLVMAASLTLGLPLGVTKGGNTQILQTGDGEFNQFLKLEISHSFYPLPMYATVLGGYNNRTNGFSDEVHFGGELGYTFFSKLTVAAKAYVVNTTYNGKEGDAPLAGVFSNNTEYFSFGPDVSYTIKNKFGINTAIGYALSGKRILASPNYSAGVYIKL